MTWASAALTAFCAVAVVGMFVAVVMDARYRAEEKRQQAEMRRHMRMVSAMRRLATPPDRDRP